MMTAGETKALGGRSAPVPRTPHELQGARTRVSPVRSLSYDTATKQL